MRKAIRHALFAALMVSCAAVVQAEVPDGSRKIQRNRVLQGHTIDEPAQTSASQADGQLQPSPDR